MEPSDACDPYRRPARRTQWLVSALAYHYGLDRGVENEIVVLATGLDQYLQEVFHHLDCEGGGTIPGQDFRTLCRVLGLQEGGEEAAAEPEELAGLCRDLSPALSFRQFHARLCGYFSTKAGCSAAPAGLARLPLGKESEHIETQIRLRSPLRRRREKRAGGGADRVAKLEDENASLRELVEDMRAALQSSDARCLALQEVELIRSSRDGQIEEAIRFNQELEKELRNSHEALVTVKDYNCSLKREQAEMRKKVEEARLAVLNSLGKVKELEAKAHKVPQLLIYIQQLESELQYYRVFLFPVEDQMFRSVEGQAASDEEEEKWTGDQQFQVAEVKKFLAKLPCCNNGCDDPTMKKLMSYFGNISRDGSENSIVELIRRLSLLTEQLETKGQEVKTLETDMEEVNASASWELLPKEEEAGLLKMELQLLETERVRLSLVGKKLLDVLQLLQQLRDLNISKRALGKILLSTLESCCDPQHGKKWNQPWRTSLLGAPSRLPAATTCKGAYFYCCRGRKGPSIPTLPWSLPLLLGNSNQSKEDGVLGTPWMNGQFQGAEK
uniref:EF-hand and coiled-coil domain containing 1 n=1 Tax=Varanus komodoensis TaxID=61221 RepID=A0A8D2KVR7_VARKO